MLGKKVRDKISGYEGIAIGRTEFLNGCIRVGIQPKLDKNGALLDTVWFDEVQIEVLGEGPHMPRHWSNQPVERPAGPRPDAVRAPDCPTR